MGNSPSGNGGVKILQCHSTMLCTEKHYFNFQNPVEQYEFRLYGLGWYQPFHKYMSSSQMIKW